MRCPTLRELPPPAADRSGWHDRWNTPALLSPRPAAPVCRGRRKLTECGTTHLEIRVVGWLLFQTSTNNDITRHFALILKRSERVRESILTVRPMELDGDVPDRAKPRC